MPDPKDNAKLTGDTHPPEVEDAVGAPEGLPDAVGADGTPRDRGQARAQDDEARPGKGENQAGFLKEKDTPDSGQGSKTR